MSNDGSPSILISFWVLFLVLWLNNLVTVNCQQRYCNKILFIYNLYISQVLHDWRSWLLDTYSHACSMIESLGKDTPSDLFTF
jgi:hypothetical protein